jgi:hypothetical protein
MTTKEIEDQLKPCRYCGNVHPKVYYRDYIGDHYDGDKYMVNCDCGISTNWLIDEELIRLWNGIFTNLYQIYDPNQIKCIICPKCHGQGLVSKPPWVAGDVDQWTSDSAVYTCDLCKGEKLLMVNGSH